ncbi:hypothetical protein [Candidatus Villigracilis affinis]|uniref:hypothetical protein n=1 Tax=Candidatus Villigracilis affinis TaxID=3140682 RepID=UPI002A1AC6F6|nr:hypothetical protein [Anaerolineales bacterium]
MLDAEWDFISAALPRLLTGDNDRLQTVCDQLNQFLHLQAGGMTGCGSPSKPKRAPSPLMIKRTRAGRHIRRDDFTLPQPTRRSAGVRRPRCRTLAG